MKQPYENPSQDQQRRLDLLTDGELSDAERRQLLLSFDCQPDGWRRCALALLEAQCWRRQMTTAATQAVQPVAGPTRTLPVGALPRDARWLPLAASVLGAFVLGIVLRDVLPGGGRSARGPVVDLEVPVRGGPPGFVQKGKAHGRQTPRADPWPARQPGAAGGVPAKADTITFLVHSRDKKRSSRSVQVPLVSAAGLNQNWLELPRATIHSDVLRRLEQAGHQIRWRRRYAPLQLDDGHRIVFPVDDLEITPIAHRVF